MRRIVESFAELAAALRQQTAVGVQPFRGRPDRRQDLLQAQLARKRRGARRALPDVVFDSGAFFGAQLFTSKENQQAFDLLAIRCFTPRSVHFPTLFHSKPSNWARNFRVARNSEFFTVSSLVPSTSPIARSFKPW